MRVFNMMLNTLILKCKHGFFKMRLVFFKKRLDFFKKRLDFFKTRYLLRKRCRVYYMTALDFEKKVWLFTKIVLPLQTTLGTRAPSPASVAGWGRPHSQAKQ